MSVAQVPPGLHVYHRPDGTIAKIELTNSPTTMAGCSRLEVPIDRTLLARGAGLKRRVTGGAVVMRPASEIAALDEADARRDVEMAIARELRRTDRYMLLDYPLTDVDRVRWCAYRQALRDLSKRGLTPGQQLAAWPKAPDGC